MIWDVILTRAQKLTHTHTHHLTALFLGLPWWASTGKVKPIWILLKQETVSGSGISWAVCQSAPRSNTSTPPLKSWQCKEKNSEQCQEVSYEPLSLDVMRLSRDSNVQHTMRTTTKARTAWTRIATSSSWAAIRRPCLVPSIRVNSTSTVTYLQ